MWSVLSQLFKFMRVYRKNIDFSDEVAKTIEATGDVEGALSKALQKSIIEGAFEAEARDLARQRVFVINRRVAERLRDEFPEPTAFSRGLRVFYDTPLAYWKAAVLPLRPAWIGNNVVGSTMFGLLEGVGPRDYRNALSKQYRMAVNEHAPMVGIGGLTAAEGRGLLRQQAGPAGSATEQVVQGLESLPPVRAFQALADRGRLVNEHVESFYRTAGFSKEIRSAVRKSYLKRTGDASLKALDELEELSNIPRADVDKAIKAVNFFHNNYFAGNPLERQVIRRIIPFESFMKHQARLLFQLPVEYPGRAFAFNATARIAEEAMAAQSDNLPEFMQDSGTQDLGFTVPIDGRKFRVLLNTQGVNPFMMGFSTTGGPGLDTGNIARSLVQQSAPPFQFGVSAATGQDQFGRPFSEMGVTGRRGRFFARPGQFPEERVKNRLGAVDEVGRPLPSPGEFAAGAVPQLGLARRLINPRSGFTADPFSTESKADESSPFMRTRLLELMRYLTPISITLLDVTEPGGRRPLSRRETISILRSLQRQENISEQGNEKSPE